MKAVGLVVMLTLHTQVWFLESTSDDADLPVFSVLGQLMHSSDLQLCTSYANGEKAHAF